jgi:hypothetical protein
MFAPQRAPCLAPEGRHVYSNRSQRPSSSGGATLFLNGGIYPWPIVPCCSAVAVFFFSRYKHSPPSELRLCVRNSPARPTPGQTAHTIGHSDDTFPRTPDSCVQPFPPLGHFGASRGHPLDSRPRPASSAGQTFPADAFTSDKFSCPGPSIRPPADSGGLGCPTLGKMSQPDAEMY